MPVIEHEATIRAAPEAVFELISRVESFVELTEAVKAIEALGDDRYRWHIRVAGLNLRFDVEVTETKAPTRFAWRSISGVENHGSYTLSGMDEGTHLQLRLEYRLKNRVLEKTVNWKAQSLVRRLGDEIVGNVEAKLG